MELDDEARRVLELAREARTPGEDDKERVARRIAVGLGLSAAASSGAAAAQGAGAAKSVGAAAALKWWIAGGAILAAVGGYAALPHGTSPAAAPGARKPVMTAAPAKAAVPSTAPDEPAAAEAAAAAPASAAKATRASEPRRRAGSAATVPAEIELLHRAQAAWRAHDARAALSLVDTHRARYPHSELRFERDALQVLSLCELGKQAEAARLARGLLERAPRSPLRSAIEQSCALK